ncbi:aspartate aminotransferase family protein [Nocardioides zeae]|uniref:Adenosylmethionine-8-amino-7-oxononanoate aminotransferase n=1 Tax=Nocardioides zeae TaxID=1457234 RepID=A0AAJ1U0G4_9ACTN|nr:aspartate aminotransferase family protein [Nocardioides zeae]MDQ1103003.1 adenosylmethionine-8-amino-7-oxononanoate aminotransferase [Nocardioides zeae]
MTRTSYFPAPGVHPAQVPSPAARSRPYDAAAARDHLWLHFTPHATSTPYFRGVTRAEGHHFWTSEGQKVFDGLSALFAVNVGHGRARLADAAARQLRELDFFPVWNHAHPAAAELAAALAERAPGDLNRVFFTNSGSEAVETAWKLAKQYFKAVGQPTRHKVVSRALAYHGTTQGALSITSIPAVKAPFEPLVPSTSRVPTTDWFRAAPDFDGDEEAFGRWSADRIAEAIELEGPETVAAIFLEPLQNSGAAIPPPPGYFQRVREIADRYGVLLVADEVITAFGRLGEFFAIERYGVVPDIITGAKGLTSGYVPAGLVLASDRLFEPFASGRHTFLHGLTFAGHPLAAAVALENIAVFEEEGLNAHVRTHEDTFAARLGAAAADSPLLGTVRGAGFFQAVVLSAEAGRPTPFEPATQRRLVDELLLPGLAERGLYARIDERSLPAILLAPPLTIGEAEIDLLATTVADVLDESWRRL